MRSKFYSALNIIGLSVGLASFIFILLFLIDELTYDKQNVRHERIYRIASDFSISGKHDKFAIVPVPMGPAFKLEFPEVETFVRFQNSGNTPVRYGDIEYYEDDFYFTDSTIFDVFTHDFVYGSPENALTEPRTIVLTRSASERYFGKENPVGEMITTGSGRSYKITAVIENQPTNVHLRYEALISGATIEEEMGSDRFNSMEPLTFWNIGVYTYILLKENSEMSSIHEKFPVFYDKYMGPIGDQLNASFALLSTPLSATHYSAGLGGDQPTGNMAYIYIFSAVALFIVLIAAINYMNMATARSTRRAREVGLRKVVGAHRGQLIGQFLGESLLLTFIALLIAVGLVIVLLPDFNTLAGKSFTLQVLLEPRMIAGMIGIAILIGLLSGSYPSFYLSRFRPVTVLKGSTARSGKKSGTLRRILVVLQFFIAIVMIIGTIVVSDQLDYLRNRDLGFDKENLVVLEMQDSAFRSKAATFREELLRHPDITAVSNSTGVPGDISWIQVMYVEREGQMVEGGVILAQTDYHYIETMGMEIVAGRDFDKNMGTDDSLAVIVNETAVKEFGWEEDPIGKKIGYGIDLEGNTARPMKVIGVVKDFHFTSLHNKVEPIILFISQVPRYYLSLRIHEADRRSTLEYIEEKWNEYGAGRPFNYEFLDQRLDQMYTNEVKLGKIFRIAALLTIFIALLGLLGLSSFTAEQRTKEIGIRKVLGANLQDIVSLLYKEFVLLIGIAFVIAVPVAWWRLSIWLDSSFVYFDVIHWYSFVIAGLLAFIIGMLTISYHIFRVAAGNPVEAVKYE